MQITEPDHEPWHLPHMAAYLSHAAFRAVDYNDADPRSNSNAAWFWSTYAVIMTITIAGIIVSGYY